MTRSNSEVGQSCSSSKILLTIARNHLSTLMNADAARGPHVVANRSTNITEQQFTRWGKMHLHMNSAGEFRDLISLLIVGGTALYYYLRRSSAAGWPLAPGTIEMAEEQEAERGNAGALVRYSFKVEGEFYG